MTAFVDTSSTRTMGAAMNARTRMGSATKEAIFSGLFRPSRLGTSSPITSEK